MKVERWIFTQPGRRGEWPVRPDVRPTPKGLVNCSSLWRQNDSDLA